MTLDYTCDLKWPFPLRCFFAYLYFVLLLGCVFVLLVLLVLLVLSARAKSFLLKKIEFKTALRTSIILLLNSYYYKHEFFNHYNLFQSLQSFSITTILFSYYNLFQLSQSFSIFTIFFNYHNFFNYHDLFQSSSFSIITSFLITIFFITIFLNLYNVWHYLYENKPTYEFHHLTYLLLSKHDKDIL